MGWAPPACTFLSIFIYPADAMARPIEPEYAKPLDTP